MWWPPSLAPALPRCAAVFHKQCLFPLPRFAAGLTHGPTHGPIACQVLHATKAMLNHISTSLWVQAAVADDMAAQKINAVGDLLLNTPYKRIVLDSIAANPAIIGLEKLAGALSNAIAPLQQTLLVRVAVAKHLQPRCPMSP